MNYTTFDVLTAHYKKDDFCSIKQHLLYLLNTRQGSLPQNPDYGLPDLQKTYQELPYSIMQFCNAIKTTIEKYEPRLRNITVTPMESEQKDSVLQLKISAVCNQQKELSFMCDFLSAGSVLVDHTLFPEPDL